MRLIAQHSLGLSKQIDAGAPADPGDFNAKPPRFPALARPPRYDQTTVAPGAEFESGDYGLSDADIRGLVQQGAVRRKTKEVEDNEAGVAASPGRSTGPASGSTSAPDPNAVADRAMAGENADARRVAEHDRRAAEGKGGPGTKEAPGGGGNKPAP